MADERKALGADRLGDASDILGEGLHRPGPGARRRPRPSVAGKIERHHTEMFGERPELATPEFLPAAPAMDQDERRPVAALDRIAQRNAVGRGHRRESRRVGDGQRSHITPNPHANSWARPYSNIRYH